MRFHGLENVGRLLHPFGGKTSPWAGRDIKDGRARRRGKGRETGELALFYPLAPFRFGEIKAVRRQRLVGNAAVSCSS